MSVDQGPTTVGSIVGKLRLDRAQWIADVAATKQDVRELEGLDPDIRIDDNAGAVITRLQAVKAATDAVDASSERLGTTTRRTTDETIRANEANRTSVSRVGAIVTAVALLVPLLAPVAAGAIGIGGAFLGMGAAGVFALIGIHREMEQGTTLGRSYRVGVDSLKSSMDTLSRTAAVAMLSSFQRVVRETRAALPDLNAQVGQFSTILGRSGANLFSGAINSLKVLNPLFLTAGLYLQSLTEGFERWSTSGGIDEFGTYALAVLPQVTEVLGKLASMVMHILQALAPLGAIGLLVLSGIADAINAIPVDVLSQLIVTITWGAVAFKAWGFIAPMLATIATSMGAVGAATTIATGPIGWVVAGLAALAGVLAVVIASNQQATTATHQYTAAIEADNGALEKNVRHKAAQLLADKGALDMADKLGIAKQDLVGYILGEADAIDRVNDSLDIFGKKLGEEGIARVDASGLSMQEFLDTTQSLQGVLDEQAGALERDAKYWRDVEEATRATTSAAHDQEAADEAVAASLGTTAAALRDARAGQEGVESATAKATAEMYLQGDAAGLLKQQLDLLNGKALSAAEAQNQFEAQLVRLPDYIDEATGKFDAAGASLDGMSESAVTNRGALLDLIQSAQNSAQAYRDQGASSEEARQKLINSKKAIEDQAVANGMNRDAVRRYLDELFKIPAKIPATKIEVDTAAAEAALAALTRSRTVTVNASLNAIKAGKELGWGYAGGGTIPGLAGGGGGTVQGRGTAGDDNAGVFRLAQGEEVVSNMFGQASRNRALLKAINAGFTPAQSTAGTVRATPSTITAAPAALAPVVQVDVHVTVLKNEDPAVVGQQVGSGVKQALAGVKL